MQVFVRAYPADVSTQVVCPPTFLLPSEGHQVLPILVLQGLLLQVLHQGVTVKWPRRALLRLVTLPKAGGQHGILGEQEVKCQSGIIVFFSIWINCSKTELNDVLHTARQYKSVEIPFIDHRL